MSVKCIQEINHIVRSDKIADDLNKAKLIVDVTETLPSLTRTKLYALLDKLNVAVPKLYPNYSTRQAMFSKIRSAITKQYGNNSPEHVQALQRMHVPKTERMEHDKSYRIRVKDRNRNRYVFHYREHVLPLVKKFESDDWRELTFALLLASGLRPIELLYIGEFKADPDSNCTLVVRGFAKSKNAPPTKRPLIHMDAELFIQNVQRLRSLLPEKPLVDNQIHPTIRNNMRDNFKRFVSIPHLQTIYDLRKLYVATVYEMSDKSSSLNVFISDIFAHNADDVSTASAYSNFIVVFESDGNKQRCDTVEHVSPKDQEQYEKVKKVVETYKAMVANGVKVTHKSLLTTSGISWRIVRQTLTSIQCGEIIV